MKSIPVQVARESLAVGAQIRSARHARRYTLDQVAHLTGMTKGFLSRVERDLTSPSVASLVTLCQVLNIEIGTLFQPSSTQVVTWEGAQNVEMGGKGVIGRLVASGPGRSLQMLRLVMAHDGHSELEPYGVDCSLEVVHIVRGAVEVSLPGGTTRLNENDTLSFPGRDPHTWHNVYAGETILLVAFIP